MLKSSRLLKLHPIRFDVQKTWCAYELVVICDKDMGVGSGLRSAEVFCRRAWGGLIRAEREIVF
jgi:hypothetical protein